jgi:iron(III) transport system substrate-binding protein
MKKKVSYNMNYLLIGIIFLGMPLISSCKSKPTVIVYVAPDPSREEVMAQMVENAFKSTDVNIDIKFISSGDIAAKVKAEQSSIEADIVLDLDYSYLENLSNYFVSLDEVINLDAFLDHLIPENKKYAPLALFGCGVMFDTSLLEGLQNPTSYDDLLNPIYKNKIEMPNPAASGTGYAFVKGLLTLKGEEEGWNFFRQLKSNIKEFTSSGSKPLKDLILKESPIIVGMVDQGAIKLPEIPTLKFLNNSEGIPYALSGGAIMKGHEEKPYVKDVFKYIFEEYFNKYEAENVFPGTKLKNQPESKIPNYPNFNYMSLTNYTWNEKEQILNKWKIEIEG